MNTDQVVLVDKQDNHIGLMDKLEAHRGNGILHRAVSVLLYRKKDNSIEVLLQQRSTHKPLWPLFWSNTICTHPRDHEAPIDCAVRRLKEEMGITIQSQDLHFLFLLLYQAKYNEEFSEHELDHVFVGEWTGKIVVEPSEAADVQWMEWRALLKDMKHNEAKYTPWFLQLADHGEVKKILSEKET